MARSSFFNDKVMSNPFRDIIQPETEEVILDAMRLIRVARITNNEGLERRLVWILQNIINLININNISEEAREELRLMF